MRAVRHITGRTGCVGHFIYGVDKDASDLIDMVDLALLESLVIHAVTVGCEDVYFPTANGLQFGSFRGGGDSGRRSRGRAGG